MDLLLGLFVIVVFGALCIGSVAGIIYAIVKATTNRTPRRRGGAYSAGTYSGSHHWTGDSGSAPWDHGDPGPGSSGGSGGSGGGSSCGGGGSSCGGGGGGSSCGGGGSS
ncbi:hypothetical protein [Nocardia sp. NPDC024068]|uniref:hypothetical protein n=1 Tax=Nocardia sp. NPDC024068 TaxID=3157197 RepID=UPI0033D00DB9